MGKQLTPRVKLEQRDHPDGVDVIRQRTNRYGDTEEWTAIILDDDIEPLAKELANQRGKRLIDEDEYQALQKLKQVICD
jgi:hypothetical protein